MKLRELFNNNIEEYVSQEKHSYKKNKMYQTLSAKGYQNSILAMDIAGNYHTGLRKDGITPEFDHQISIARFLMKFTGSMDYPDETLAVAMLHDLSEDYSFPYELVKKYFGSKIRKSVELVTKEYKGVKMIPEIYFNNIAHDPIASIVKGADRIHNLHTLTGFPQHKKDEQSDETEYWIIPMLEIASERFPSQKPIYDKFLSIMRLKINKLRL